MRKHSQHRERDDSRQRFIDNVITWALVIATLVTFGILLIRAI